MKIIKSILLLAVFITGATAFSSASEKKNKVIVKEISMTTYSQLMGAK